MVSRISALPPRPYSSRYPLLSRGLARRPDIDRDGQWNPHRSSMKQIPRMANGRPRMEFLRNQLNEVLRPVEKLAGAFARGEKRWPIWASTRLRAPGGRIAAFAPRSIGLTGDLFPSAAPQRKCGPAKSVGARLKDAQRYSSARYRNDRGAGHGDTAPTGRSLLNSSPSPLALAWMRSPGTAR